MSKKLVNNLLNRTDVDEKLVEKYNEEVEKQRKYCYKPHRTIHNY